MREGAREADDRHSSPQNTLGERFHTVRFYEREGGKSLAGLGNEEINIFMVQCILGKAVSIVVLDDYISTQNKASSR